MFIVTHTNVKEKLSFVMSNTCSYSFISLLLVSARCLLSREPMAESKTVFRGCIAPIRKISLLTQSFINHRKMVILMLTEMSFKFYSIADWWIHFHFYSRVDKNGHYILASSYRGNRIVMINKTVEKMHKLMFSYFFIFFMNKILF